MYGVGTCGSFTGGSSGSVDNFLRGLLMPLNDNVVGRFILKLDLRLRDDPDSAMFNTESETYVLVPLGYAMDLE